MAVLDRKGDAPVPVDAQVAALCRETGMPWDGDVEMGLRRVVAELTWNPDGPVDLDAVDRRLGALEEACGVTAGGGTDAVSLAERAWDLADRFSADGASSRPAGSVPGPSPWDGVETDGTPDSYGPWDAPDGYGPWGEVDPSAPAPVGPDTPQAGPVMPDPDMAWSGMGASL